MKSGENGAGAAVWAMASLAVAAVVGEASQATLTAQRPSAPVGVASEAAGFTLKLTADLGKVKERETLLEIPGALEVWVRQESGSGGGQNYGAFRAADGSCPVLEAKVLVHSHEHPEWKEMTVGVPLARLTDAGKPQEIELRFAGARWQMRVGGQYDEDFPFGRVLWATNAVWALTSPRATSAELWAPPLADVPCPASRPVKRVQYFSRKGTTRGWATSRRGFTTAATTFST